MKNLYKKVQTHTEHNVFNRIWIDAWEEKGYELEFSQSADRCLVQDEWDLFVGTVEFKQYVPQSEINHAYPFHSVKTIQSNHGKIVEVDKVALIKEHRGKNLDRLLAVISRYTENHNYHFCIALIEPRLFIALKRFYRLPIEKLGEKMFYKGDDVIPIMINVSFVNRNKQKYAWLIKSIADETLLPPTLNKNCHTL